MKTAWDYAAAEASGDDEDSEDIDGVDMVVVDEEGGDRRNESVGLRVPPTAATRLAEQGDAKRRMVGEWAEKAAMNAQYSEDRVRDCKGLLSAMHQPIGVRLQDIAQGSAYGAMIDFDVHAPVIRVELADDDAVALGFSTLFLRLPRVAWHQELLCYLHLLQEDVTPAELGLSATEITRDAVLRAVSWFAAQGAFYALLHYERGLLWHSYQAVVGDSRRTHDDTLPFCRCAPNVWVRRGAALPHDHPHRWLSRDALRDLEPGHYNFFPVTPHAPEHRVPFLDWLRRSDFLGSPEFDGDRSRLLGYLTQAERSLEMPPMSANFLPPAVNAVFHALGPSALHLLDMTVLFGLWTLQGAPVKV